MVQLSKVRKQITHRRLIAGGVLFALITLGNAYAQNNLTLNSKAYADGQHLVSVFVDGNKRVVATSATTVGVALKQFDVQVSTGDVVEPAANTVIDQPIFNVNIYRALPATIFDDGKKIQVLTGYQSARQIITAAGLTSYPEDIVRMDRVDDFTLGATVGRQVTIKCAKPVQVVLAGQVYNFRTQQETVGALLAEHGLKVQANDVMNVGLSAPLNSGQRIVVNRLGQSIIQEKAPVPAGVSYEYDGNQPLGYSAVKQVGKDGTKIVSYLVNLTNGVETSRSKLDEKVIEAVVNQIVVRGSKVASSATAGSVQEMIVNWARHYGVSETQLLRVAKCESNYNPAASNGTHFGVFQFSPSTYAANYPRAGASSNYWDADSNVHTAAYMFSIGQAGQWQCK